MILLQIYHWVCQLKNFENQLTFGEVMGKSFASCFLDSRCIFLFLPYQSTQALTTFSHTSCVLPYSRLLLRSRQERPSIAMTASVCLSVCLRAYLHNYAFDPDQLCMLPMSVAPSSCAVEALRCVCSAYFQFYRWRLIWFVQSDCTQGVHPYLPIRASVNGSTGVLYARKVDQNAQI